MVIHTVRSADEKLPADAIRLTRQEALHLQVEMLKSWTPASDVYALKYGMVVKAITAACSSIYIHHYFRYKLRLLHYGRATTYLPAVAIPTFVCMAAQAIKVRDAVLLQEIKCPVCIELKSSAIQVTFGFFFPLGLAPLATFMMASRFNTYPVPMLSKEPKAVFQLFLKMIRAKSGGLMSLFCLSAGLAAFVTYLEGRSLYTVMDKLEYDSEGK